MINKRHILPSFHNWKYGFLGVQIYERRIKMQPVIDLFDAYLEKHEKLADFIVSFNIVDLLICLSVFPSKLLPEIILSSGKIQSIAAFYCFIFLIITIAMLSIISFKSVILKKRTGKYFITYRKIIQKSRLANSPIVAIIFVSCFLIFQCCFVVYLFLSSHAIDMLKLIPISIVIWELLLLARKAIEE